MDEPVKVSFSEAHVMIKQGKKVTLNGDPLNYWCLRGPDDDPGIQTVGLWHYNHGSWRNEQLPVPSPNEDFDKKDKFEDLEKRVAYNTFLKENPPKEIPKEPI